MRRYPILVAILAGAVLAGLLPARSNRSGAAVAYAATRTLDAGTSRIEIRFLDDRTPFRVSGVLDFRNHRGRLDFGPGGEQMILDGPVTYHEAGTWLSGAQGKWIRYDPGESDPFELQERVLLDPAQLLAFLRQASGDVNEVGRDTVRGVPTTHLEGTLDLRKLVEQTGRAERAKVQDALDSMSEDGPTVFRYGIWVDDENVARRLRIHGDPATDATIDFYDFGVPATIDVPSSAELISRDELFAAMEKVAQANESDCNESELVEREDSADELGESKVVLCVSGSVDIGPGEDGHK